ncbi:MAG: hypothetical protein AMXMBFR58_29590 [Phycisphaerae bacterium]
MSSRLARMTAALAGMLPAGVQEAAVRAMGGIRTSVKYLRPMSYEGGQITRIDPDFVPMRVGPNLLADQSLDMVQRRSRWLSDNHPLISGAVETFVANVVSSEIYPRPATPFEEVNKRIDELFWDWAEAVDAERSTSLLEHQQLVARELFSKGEILVHSPFAEAWEEYAADVALETIDTDLLCDPAGASALGVSSYVQLANGNRVRQGVEFDSVGRRVAYHVLDGHPNDGEFVMPRPERMRRLPAAVANLAMIRRRSKQIRGVPRLVALIRLVRQESGFSEAFLELARVAACYGIWIEGVGSANMMANGTAGAPTDMHGRPIQEAEPGLIGRLPPGAKVSTTNAAIPPPTFDSTLKSLKRDMSAAVGQSYGEFSGDYGEATFSSERARQLLTRRIVRPVQACVWRQGTLSAYKRCIAFWIASGRLKLSAEARAAWMTDPRQLYRHDVIAPGFEWVNPQQEAQAAEIELRIGAASLEDIVASKGRNWQDTLERQLQIEVWYAKRRAELGLAPRPLMAEKAGGGGGKTEPAKGGDQSDESDQRDEEEDA